MACVVIADAGTAWSEERVYLEFFARGQIPKRLHEIEHLPVVDRQDGDRSPVIRPC